MAKTADAKPADADSPQDSPPDRPQDSPPDFRTETNRVAPAVMTGLAIVLLLGAIVATSGKKKKEPPGEEGVRALVVPTSDMARTVVVAPCGTGRPVTAGNATAQVETFGSTVVRLPPATVSRVLLIPRCSENTSEAGAEPVAQVPSSVFVLTTGATNAVGTKGSGKKKKKTKKDSGEPTLEPRSQLILPSASAGQTVVVPPCTGKGRATKATVLSPAAGNPTVLLAPPC